MTVISPTVLLPHFYFGVCYPGLLRFLSGESFSFQEQLGMWELFYWHLKAEMKSECVVTFGEDMKYVIQKLSLKLSI